MERFTRPLLRSCGVRLIIGKGGLGSASLAAFGELGGAYLAVVGGTAALETTWIEADRGRRPGRPPPGEPVALPRARFRAAAGGDGQPRRQLYATVDAEARAAGARRRAGRARRQARWVRSCHRRAVAMRATANGYLDPRRRRGGAVRRAACASGRSRARHHRRGQGPARQMRLHAHGPGRLQRRARRGRFGRAALHGHDRGRRVAARPGTRLDAGHRRGGARARAGKRTGLLFRPQSRRHACIRRPSPARPSTAPCTRAT